MCVIQAHFELLMHKGSVRSLIVRSDWKAVGAAAAAFQTQRQTVYA